MELLDLKHIQQEELNILVPLASFLEAHHLRYTLSSGTLLGAVRHGGFIPWDDDIDLYMPRPDYDAFKALASELPEPLIFMDWESGKDYGCFPVHWGKVCSKDFRAEEHGLDADLTQLLWVDIFPIDGMPSGAFAAKVHHFKAYVLLTLRTIMTADVAGWSNKARRAFGKFYKGLPGKKARIRSLDRRIEKNCKKYAFGATDKVENVSCASRKFRQFDYAFFVDYAPITFEGKQFQAVARYHELLTLTYGNYMQLPPVEQRVLKHGLKVWRACPCEAGDKTE